MGTGQLLTTTAAVSTAAAVTIGGAAAVWASPAAAAFAAGGVARFGVRSHLRADGNRPASVALTFDDGPQQQVTERYLDLFAERGGIQVTFFVVGEHAREQRPTIERMVAEGHSVQSHGMRHCDHLLRTPRDARRDMFAAAEVIGDITGVGPTLYRPPHGVATVGTLLAARALKQQVVLWSRWARDWERRSTSAAIAHRVLDDLQRDEIVLLHDADPLCAAQLGWHLGSNLAGT